MWITWWWSWCDSSGDCDKFRDHPVLVLFETNNVLSRIEVTRLKSKRRLCFSQGDTKVNQLPEVLWECSDLEKLYLCNNTIRKLPAEISNLQNLTVLSLANNQLESFPEEITLLLQLKWLNLSGNCIPEFPESVQRIKYLEVLWCNNAKVQSWDGVANCRNLTTLGFRGNLIQSIPESISQLVNLTWLTMENNRIDGLPASMKALQNLVHLNLQNNCIRDLPNFFSHLTSLKYVFLNSNRIGSVHLMHLFDTNHLQVFDLNDNPFPDEHIIPVLKLFPHVTYFNQCSSRRQSIPQEEHHQESDENDTDSDWDTSSIATSDLDSISDSDCDMHEFDEIPTVLPLLSKFITMS